MARRTFFSFHYNPDVARAQIVRNVWVTKQDREDAGFFDSSVFESKKNTNDDALRQFLIDGFKNTTVTCVLVGAETYLRPWVRFELIRSFYRGNGLLAINVAGLTSFGKRTVQGPNPFDYLAFSLNQDRVCWKQKWGDKWNSYTDVPTMSINEVAYDLKDKTNHTFATLFPIYDWVNDQGYENLGSWIERAAKLAGK